MWELNYKESWALKYCWWCCRRFFRVPWTARISNQSILKVISPRCSLEGLMLKLKLQFFGHLMRRADFLKRLWCWEWLRSGGEGDNKGWDGWMGSLTQWIWVWVNLGVDEQRGLVFCSSWDLKESDMTERWTKQNCLMKPHQIATEQEYLAVITNRYSLEYRGQCISPASVYVNKYENKYFWHFLRIVFQIVILLKGVFKIYMYMLVV